MRLACVVPDIGNYHHARLQAIGLAKGVELSAVELYESSGFGISIWCSAAASVQPYWDAMVAVRSPCSKEDEGTLGGAP